MPDSYGFSSFNPIYGVPYNYLLLDRLIDNYWDGGYASVYYRVSSATVGNKECRLGGLSINVVFKVKRNITNHIFALVPNF